MYPRWQDGSATHRECEYFNSGLCALNCVVVSPDKPACPNFKPKGIPTTRESGRSYQRLRRLPRISMLRSPLAPLSPSDWEETSTPAQQLASQCGYGVFPRGVYRMPSGGAGGRGRHGRESGRGTGGLAAGVDVACIYPSHGYTRPNRPGIPGFRQKRHDCGAPRTRRRWRRDERARRAEIESY